MLKIIAAATFSAMCRDLGPLSPVFRWVLAPLFEHRVSRIVA
ncbi:MAG: hypothetical protein WA781_19855 [Pseudolabrys sp.]|jgi:hypothetical protein